MSSKYQPVVALTRCASYDREKVDAAVQAAIDHLGGIEAFVKPGQRVLIKPNLVRALPPDRAATTHPAVVMAVARLVREAGATPLIVESPGGPYTPASLRACYRKTGLWEAAEAEGIALNLDTGSLQVSFPEAKVLHRIDVVAPLTQCDLVINVPKLKTHNLTGLTMGVKNLFGLVPGALKIGYHAKLQEKRRFCEGLIDILLYVRPALQVMDAVIAMEGEGPTGGKPRALGAIVASADALALDIVGASLVGYDPLSVATIEAAAQRGLTTGRLEDITLVGEPLADLRVNDWEPGIEAPLDPGLLPGPLRWLARVTSGDGQKGLFHSLAHGWLWRQMVAIPVAGEKCIGCGFCAQHCPAKAITILDGRAQMDLSRCIRCYCCHELCPHDAIDLVKPWLGRALQRWTG